MSISGVGVVMRDDQGRAICGTVTVANSEHSETLEERGRNQLNCSYFGLRDRGGRYTVTATAPGYKTVEQTMTIGTGSCGVENPASLEVRMERM